MPTPSDPFDLKKILLNFDPEDDLALVIKAHIQIERILNETLKGLSTKIKHLNYHDQMGDNQMINLLGALGLNPELIQPLRELVKLRGKFAHYNQGIETILDEKMVEKLIESFGPKLQNSVELLYKNTSSSFYAGDIKKKPRQRFHCFYMILVSRFKMSRIDLEN